MKEFNQIIKFQNPDIFLLEVMLPDGNGSEVCQLLKQNPKNAHIPIIMTSANNSLLDIKNKCTADDFIAKPFNISDFIAKFNSLFFKK